MIANLDLTTHIIINFDRNMLGEEGPPVHHHLLDGGAPEEPPVDAGAPTPVPARDLQAAWVAQSSADVTSALGTVRNVSSPNVQVSR